MRHGKKRIVIGHCLEEHSGPRIDDSEPPLERHWSYLLHNPDMGPFRRQSAEAAYENELVTVVEHAARLLGVTE
jgi:hypothetical protein